MLGVTIWSFGVFFKPLETEFGWTRALTSSAYTIFLIGYAASVIVIGRLIDRLNPRVIMIICAIVTGTGFFLCSFTQNIDQLRIFYLIMSLGAGVTLSLPNSMVQKWFYQRKHAGLAVAIVVSGVGIGALVFAPLINWLILAYGWRVTYQVLALIFFAVVIISSFIIKQSPVTIISTDQRAAHLETKKLQTGGLSTRQALATWALAGITFVHCAGQITFQSVSVHFVPFATDQGFSPTAAAAAFGLTGLFSVLGRLASGYISDKIGWQKVITIACSGLTVSLIWLLFSHSIWMIYCFSFMFGVFLAWQQNRLMDRNCRLLLRHAFTWRADRNH